MGNPLLELCVRQEWGTFLGDVSGLQPGAPYQLSSASFFILDSLMCSLTLHVMVKLINDILKNSGNYMLLVHSPDSYRK